MSQSQIDADSFKPPSEKLALLFNLHRPGRRGAPVLTFLPHAHHSLFASVNPLWVMAHPGILILASRFIFTPWCKNLLQPGSKKFWETPSNAQRWQQYSLSHTDI